MRLLFLCAFVALAALCGAVEDPDVLVLTQKNFQETIQNNPLVLVEFYAPWCGHCKRLAPEYATAATELKDEGVVLGKVDATVESELGSQYEIQGYPTLKIFREGVPSEYNGGRTSADIVSYMRKQTGPAVSELTSAEELEKFIPDDEKEDAVVVAFVAAGSDQDKAIRSFANKQRDNYKFGVVTDAAVAKGKGEKEGTVVLFKPYDDKRSVFDHEFDETELANFLGANSMRWVDEIGPNNYQKYVERKLPLFWLFLDPKKQADVDAAIGEFKKVAPDHRDISFVHLDGVRYAQMVTKMALSGNTLPALALESPGGDHYPYPEDQELTAEGIRSFLQKYKAGELSPKIRSEQIPANPVGDDGVYVLVGDSFDSVVMDKSKDVLVEFYAPWCGHCKQLEPIYAEVAQALRGSNVVVAKMDATTNDPPKGFQVQGFPTIKLVTANDNKVVEYDGQRTKEGFLKFLKEHGKAEVKDEL